MINLLPLQQKEELRQEENFRLILILGILILVFLIDLTFILFSIKIFITSEVQIQKILVSQKEKEFENSQIQTLQEKIIKTNQTLSALDSFYQKELNLTEILEKISKTLPLKTYLTNLSITPRLEEEQEWRIGCSLSGFSPTREILLEFKKNLEEEKGFSKINFPPSNWVTPENINFTVSFEIKWP